MNAQEAVPILNTLQELGHQQPPTTIRTDNSTAHGIMKQTVRQRKSKSMDMKFWWLVDRVQQNQFKVSWEHGKNNLVDYISKNHPAAHHKKVHPFYVYMKNESLSLLQGCDKILAKCT